MPVEKTHFSWSAAFNITISKNRLADFPALASSSYASRYRVGEPLNLLLGYRFLGVHPTTGVYDYEDVNGDGRLTSADYLPFGSTDPEFYGGFSNTLKWRSWSLDVLFQFVKAKNFHQFYRNINVPGSRNNQPVDLLAHWQKPGDQFLYQRYSTTIGTPAYLAANNLLNSSAVLTDASFVRCKNISLAYSFSSSRLKAACRLFIQAQNPFLISTYQGADPEVGSYQTLPPLRIITGGFSLQF